MRAQPEAKLRVVHYSPGGEVDDVELSGKLNPDFFLAKRKKQHATAWVHAVDPDDWCMLKLGLKYRMDSVSVHESMLLNSSVYDTPATLFESRTHGDGFSLVLPVVRPPTSCALLLPRVQAMHTPHHLHVLAPTPTGLYH